MHCCVWGYTVGVLGDIFGKTYWMFFPQGCYWKEVPFWQMAQSLHGATWLQYLGHFLETLVSSRQVLPPKSSQKVLEMMFNRSSNPLYSPFLKSKKMSNLDLSWNFRFCNWLMGIDSERCLPKGNSGDGARVHPRIKDQLREVRDVQATRTAFAAILADQTVPWLVRWILVIILLLPNIT